MTTRFDNLRRAIALGLAIWLIVLSASVHMLHKHSIAEWIEQGAWGPVSVGQSDDHISSPTYLSQLSEQERAKTHVSELCPVCLFLANHKAERTAVPPAPTPRDAGTKYAPCGPPVFVTVWDLPSTAPRAPPC